MSLPAYYDYLKVKLQFSSTQEILLVPGRCTMAARYDARGTLKKSSKDALV